MNCDEESDCCACFICKDKPAFAPCYLSCFQCACNPTASPACYKCLRDFLAQHKKDGFVKCFTCNATAAIGLNALDCIQANAFSAKYMDAVLSTAELACPHCGARVEKHADALSHAKQCEKMPASCRYVGCEFAATQADVRDHEQLCPHGTRRCNYCSLRVPTYDMARHQTFGSCVAMPVPCPFCDQTPRFAEYVEHVQAHARDAEALSNQHRERSEAQERIRNRLAFPDVPGGTLASRAGSVSTTTRFRRRREPSLMTDDAPPGTAESTLYIYYATE